MRIAPALGLLVACFTIGACDVRQQSSKRPSGPVWYYDELIEPSTNKIVSKDAVMLGFPYDFSFELSVGCNINSMLMDVRILYPDFLSKSMRSMQSIWSIDHGEVLEFEAVSFGRSVLVDIGADRLARKLVNAKQVITTNGEGKILEFENPSNGEVIEQILKICGH